MKITFFSVMLASAVALLILCTTMAEETSKKYYGRYSSVKIYFVHWDIITRVLLSPADVRRIRHVYIEINEEPMISEIADAIFSNDFHERSDPSPAPARLVVDFITKDGTVTTVYANKSHMLTEDSSKYKIMDDKLLNKIVSIFDRNM